MLFENLPDTTTKLSRVTFGGASLSGEGGGYGFGEMSESESETLVKAAWDAGINVFDTAPIYGFGLSEERLGRYLPKEAFVITKSGVDWHPNKRVNMSNSREITEKMLHESLRRLKRDVIDLYMIHWPDQKVDIRGPLEILLKAKNDGKIKHIGLCNTNLDDLKKAKEICDVKAIQSELNYFNHEPFDRLGDEWKNFFSMSWGTFDKGILTGRVNADRKYASVDARSWAPWWNKKDVQKKIERTAEIKQILDTFNISLTDFCIHYNLSVYGISTCLIGFKTVGDILQVSMTLQQNHMRERIEEVLDTLQNPS